MADLRRPSRAEGGLLVLLGLGLGLSSLFNGLYDASAWGPAGLAAAALLLATVVSRSAAISARVLLVAGGLTLLGVTSLVSANWAADGSAALTDGARWLVFAALLLAIGALTPTHTSRRVLHVALAGGCALVGLYIEARLLMGRGETLFNGRRLLEPVGYANGQAALLLMGFWLAFAIAERARHGWLATVAVFVGSLQLGLTVLTQTRAAIPAVLLSVVVVLAMAPGRTRRGWLLVACAVTPLIALPAALDVYDGPHGLPPADALTQPAGRMILLGAAVSALLWLAATQTTTRLVRRMGWEAGRARRLGGALLAAIALLGAVGSLVVVGNPVTRVSHGWETFRSLRQPPPDQSRFASVGGNRYDYWRVAVDQFKADPLRGVGAGNYKQTYPQLRATSEYIQQPHSIELQALSELGLLGLVSMLVLIGGIVWCVVSGLRRPVGQTSAAGVAGAAVLVVWLTQTSVDWLHLLPGVTGVALCAVALTVPSPTRRLRLVAASALSNSPLRRARHSALPVVLAVIAVLTGLVATRVTLGDRYRTEARRQLQAGDVERALGDIARSLRYDPQSADAFYLRSAALARRNDYQGAVNALAVVNERQPQNFLPWVLRGDLAVLRQDRAAAVDSYARARVLNPEDPSMAANVRRAQQIKRTP